MTQVIDLHIHIMPHEMMKPRPLELITRGRTDFEQVERFCHDPKAFLKYLDSINTARAGLINYVAPEIIGFTPAVNDWVANFAKADPFRLIAFGGVHPGTVSDAGAEVDRIAKLGIRAIKIHPSHQALTPNSYLTGNTELRKIYERAQHHRLPIMIHTGTSIFPGARNVHAGEDGCAGVNHDGEAVMLGAVIYFAEFGVAVKVGVGREGLVGGVDLDGADAEFGDAVDFGAGVGELCRGGRRRESGTRRKLGIRA